MNISRPRLKSGRKTVQLTPETVLYLGESRHDEWRFLEQQLELAGGSLVMGYATAIAVRCVRFAGT
jgi:hypothetical protein